MNTLKLARMGGEWFFSDSGDEWHVMACSEVDYLVASRGTEECEVLYYPPIGNNDNQQYIEDKGGYNETVAYGLARHMR